MIQIVHPRDELNECNKLKTVNIDKRIAMNIKQIPAATGHRMPQTFELAAPTAKHVDLVGDFTRWEQQPIHLSKSKDGIWRTSVNLETGPHEYRFMVDDQWCDDPKCAQHVPNPYGGQNDVRQVG